jgi:hypothetical protein
MNPQRIQKQTPEAAHSGKTRLRVTPPQQALQRSLFDASAVAEAEAGGEAALRMVMRGTDTLKPHPSLLKLDLSPTNERLLALEKLGDTIFEQPLLITQENVIVDGYARWRIARHQQRDTILCQVCQLTEQEALQRILQTSRRPEWLNAFSRVQLALDLEPWFREKARANQSAGGKEKVSSKLTEDRRIDCRKQIANLAGVSTGNVTKVKQILDSAGALQLIEALRPGEISIHRAWTLHKLSTRERESALGYQRSKKRTSKRLQKLLAGKIPKSDSVFAQLQCLVQCLKVLKNTPCMASLWKEIDNLVSAIEHKFPSNRSDSNAHQTDHQADIGRQSEPLGQCTEKSCGPRELPEDARLPDLCTGG